MENNTKVDFDDKQYDVFFTYGVSEINPKVAKKFLDNDGKMKLIGKQRDAQDGNREYKCFCLNVANKKNIKENTYVVISNENNNVFKMIF